jgi:hypothetical protein
MTNLDPPPLGGEADQNSWHFQNIDEGPLPNPVGHTFPIITHSDQGIWSLIGTGFYVSSDGLFVTARHNVEPVLRDGRQIAPLLIIHFHSPIGGLFGPSEVLFRPIMQCWLGQQADIALGVAATCTNNQTGERLTHRPWQLSWSIPAVGARVGTYAFPRHQMSPNTQSVVFQPELYRGTVLSTGDFRDRIIIPFPYVEVDCRIHGAASGGPIALNGGGVVAVNCTEMTRAADPGPGYGCRIQCLRDAFIDDAALANEDEFRRVAFDELVRSGCIDIPDYVPRDPEQPLSGSLVRLDQVPPTAPPPQIKTIFFA